MAQKDKTKWNKKYQNTPSLLEERAPSQKLKEVIHHVKGKKALDVACGAGKHSIYLAQNGFEVDALDISSVALDTLNKKGYKNITSKLIDLDEYEPEPNSYDLIVKTNFLDKKLITKLAKALKKGGVMFIETYMNHSSNNKPNSNPDFLLQKEELKSFFDKNFDLLDYDEFDNETYEIFRMKKQSIAVRKS